MFIRTPADLGAVIRDRRRQLKLDQAAFAKRIGVSRQWVIEIERGHPRAELGLVLRALDALNIRIDVDADQTVRRRAHGAVDINAIVDKAKRPGHDQ
ncbi:helix-turn-helix domain-containing protein [Reyranella sp.]|uniref:helix-turn-helix domain-containing protein n=1 Tax=Reyranella sp. TaxID=1929291 RepID=UPI002730E277|nr:helix-turn-helix domain-containing protein [Reyranella sp.]MDP2378392.1 helix-turn-helix domain-containing protein [Reyranella sp.]